MKDFLMVREAAGPDQLNRSPAWVRAAIKAEKLKAERVNGRLLMIPKSEVARVKENPITITREEMFG